MKRPPLYFIIALILLVLIYPIPIIQVACIGILSLAFLSFIYSLIIKNSLKLTRKRSLFRLSRNREETIELQIRNKGILPVPFLLIKDMGGGCFLPDEGVFLTSLPARREVRLTSGIKSVKRGKHKIGPVILEGWDPLRLFPWKKTVPCYCEILFHPNTYPLNLLLTRGDTGGTIKVHSLLHEDETFLKGIRDYQRGDSLKKINWKATARHGKLKTMEHSSTISAPVLVVASFLPDKYPQKYRYTYMERAIEAAASLVCEYTSLGQKAGIICENLMIPQAGGNEHCVTILDHLAAYDFPGDKGESPLSRLISNSFPLERGSQIYYLTPCLTDEELLQLEVLSTRGNTINLILTGKMKKTALYNIPKSFRFYQLTEYGKEILDEKIIS